MIGTGKKYCRKVFYSAEWADFGHTSSLDPREGICKSGLLLELLCIHVYTKNMSTNENLFSTHLDDLPGYAFVTDSKGNLLQANTAAQTDFSLNLTTPASSKIHFSQLFPYHEEDWSCLLQGASPEIYLEEILRGGEGQELRVFLRGKKQKTELWLWLVSDFTSVQDDRQGMIDYMAEITAAQAKIREYAGQIEVFRKIVDGMEQGIVLTNAEGRVTFANSFAEKLFGVPLAHLAPEHWQALTTPVNEDLNPESVPNPHPKGEVLVLNEPQGRQIRCYRNVAPLTKAKNETHLVWTFFELTEEIANTQAFIDFSTELSRLNRELEQKNAEILELMQTDHLTGIANRMTVMDFYEKAAEALNRQGNGEFAVMLFDADHFKQVNDDYGHLKGDEVLKALAEVTRQTVSNQGLVGRYGGEEFLVITPGLTQKTAQELANQLLQSALQATAKTGVKVSITLGLAAYRPGQSLNEVLETADKALYRGKNQGRNQVVLAV